jgi:hypothetical protein
VVNLLYRLFYRRLISLIASLVWLGAALRDWNDKDLSYMQGRVMDHVTRTLRERRNDGKQ